MNHKKLISALLALTLILSVSVFGFTGCDNSNVVPQPTESITESTEAVIQTEATEVTDAPTEPSSEATEAPEESSEATEAPTQSTQPETQPTQPPQTQPTQPPQQETQPTQPETQPTEEPTEPEETKPSSAGAVLSAAYALGKGQYLDGTHTLTGVITAVTTAYSSHYGNITVNIVVPGYENMPMQCFRLQGSGVEDLIPGDTITVTGRIMNYKGTIEFDAGCHLDSVSRIERPEKPTNPPASNNDDSKQYVARYIHTYGKLPDFYMTKSRARSLYGWTGGPLDKLAPGMCIGGDTFYNNDGQLPDAPGRYWKECDIDTIGRNERGAKRIVFSNDGLVYYTEDHYDSFELLYGEP
jgi:guanyl-specific ribonuclease Sa